MSRSGSYGVLEKSLEKKARKFFVLSAHCYVLITTKLISNLQHAQSDTCEVSKKSLEYKARGFTVLR
jgi:hypothetical protein